MNNVKIFSKNDLSLVLIMLRFLPFFKLNFFYSSASVDDFRYKNFYLNKNFCTSFFNFINLYSLELLGGKKKVFFTELELIGLGYRMSLKKDRIGLGLGYSHIVYLRIPKDVFIVKKKYIILVYSLSRASLGLFVSTLLKFKKLSPYKLKGLKKRHLIYKLKPGKRSK